MTRAIGLVITCVSLAAAARAEDVAWKDLCARAGSHQVSVKMNDRRTVSGRCVGVTEAAISVNAGWGVPVLARRDVVFVRIDKRGTSHCLAKTAHVAGASLFNGLMALASPEFFLSPIFLAASPAILAGGTPPCAIYDLINRITVGGTEKITIK